MPKTKPFRELMTNHADDPVRRARREQYKREMQAVLALTELRRRHGLTQKALAKTLGITQARISRIERGADLQVSTVQSYVEALGGQLEVNVVLPDEKIPLLPGPKSKTAPQQDVG